MTTHDFNLYKKMLLNNIGDNTQIIDFLEYCLEQESEVADHTYHKIIAQDWVYTIEELADSIKEHFSATFIPVNYVAGQKFCTFYTCNLNLILQAIRSDFQLPYKNQLKIRLVIYFNDKTSIDLFGTKISLDDIVSGVVSNRFTENFELNLSNFCNDSEFLDKNLSFYRLTLLSKYKNLMLKIAPSTKTLNLSNNNLVQIPSEILNFFIKGDLTDINLSHNKIPSIKELVRISSRIEKLWLEGNPLCSDKDAMSYLQEIYKKFPRLKELDGVAINQHGMVCPFWRNYVVKCDRMTRMLTEKFISLYFSHYDASSRKKIGSFYDDNATLTISGSLTDAEAQGLIQYSYYSRNIIHPFRRQYVASNQKMYNTKEAIVETLSTFPDTVHDPTTFTVDVIKDDRASVIIIVDGIYKEIYNNSEKSDRYFQFRRTFVFTQTMFKSNVVYTIKNEMFSISLATTAQINNSFKNPVFNLNTLALVNPAPEDVEVLYKAFSYLTNLKRTEVEYRLKKCNWDIVQALQGFSNDLRNDKIPLHVFNEQNTLYTFDHEID